MPILKGIPIKPYGKNLFSKNTKTEPIKRKTNNRKQEANELKKYTVWVGGTEITDFFVTYSIAKELLKQYNAIGYSDVIIQEGR